MKNVVLCLLLVRKNAETVKNRLNTFHNETEPLKEFYSKKGLLISVEGQEEVADTTALVFKALSAVEA